MTDSTNKLQSTLSHIHFYVQLMQNKRISYAEMAEIGGISQRTFAEWMRGGCSPAAVEAVLKMLALLPAEELDKIFEIWRPPPISPTELSRKKSRPAQRRTAHQQNEK